MAVYFCYCFFFLYRAEDGRRDGRVTGVQTCALPISEHGDEGLLDQIGEVLLLLRRGRVDPQGEVGARDVLPAQRLQLVHRRRPQLTVTTQVLVEIGRASCRERAGSSERGGAGREGIR